MFREASKRRRYLVPASGYFEWKPEGSAKQPYFIHDPEGELLMFAGLWESWRETKESNRCTPSRSSRGRQGSSPGDIHDRAPVILEERTWWPWLFGEPADAAVVLKATQESRLTYYAVPKAVGSVKKIRQDLWGQRGT
jgi:putative SOS response-associated peptidase YedK